MLNCAISSVHSEFIVEITGKGIINLLLICLTCLFFKICGRNFNILARMNSEHVDRSMAPCRPVAEFIVPAWEIKLTQLTIQYVKPTAKIGTPGQQGR
jgi:hypothetical protein